MKILLIEDELDFARRVSARLGATGFIVEHTADASAALDMQVGDGFSAIVLDLGLPGLSGREFIRRWREDGQTTPILVLTARSGWQEKVDCLNLGADDYVTKPIRSEELVARLHALIRRSNGSPMSKLVAGDVEIDPPAKSAWLNGQPLHLSQIEYRLLHLFVLRAGHILSQGDIADHLYPMSKERDMNTVEVHISRLRRKIGKDAIITVRGLGYRLDRSPTTTSLKGRP
jgi:two-component system, OmpR family, response regulator